MDGRIRSGRKTGDKSELLSPDEMNRLLSVVKDDLYFYTLYSLLRFSGRRIGEVYGTFVENYSNGKLDKSQMIGGLQLKDLDFINSTIRTRILKSKKIQTKRKCSSCGLETKRSKEKFCCECGNKLGDVDIQSLLDEKRKHVNYKYMPMTSKIKEILKNYVEKHKFSDEDYIFRLKSLKDIQKKIKIHIRIANIDKKFSIHGFRTYFISLLIKNGMTENQIVKWTGHSNTASLINYNQLVPDDVKDKVEKIEF